MKKEVIHYLVTKFIGRRKGLIPQAAFLNDITIIAAAKELALSSRTLMRRLELNETTFSDLLRDVKIQFASEYLHDHTLSVEAIAELVGFRDRSGLTVFLNRELGRSPQEYRTANNINRPDKGKSNKLTSLQQSAKKPVIKTSPPKVIRQLSAIGSQDMQTALEAFFRLQVDKRIHGSITQEEYVSSFSVKAFSDHCKISTRTIMRRLNELQTTFSNVQDNFRFDLAQELLLHSDYTSSQISELLAYRDRASFYNLVYRKTGCSPNIFRKSTLVVNKSGVLVNLSLATH